MQELLQNTYVVIPAKNEEKYIGTLIANLTALGFAHIVLVNDCSSDATRAIAESFDQVIVLDHIINLGPGAATQTGIAYAVDQEARYIATIDADMQHDPEDLLKLLIAIRDHEAGLVIGSRFLQENEIPRSRRIFNKLGNIVSFFLSGKFLSDSQSGLKVIDGELAKTLNLNYDGFEFCMEIIKHAHSKRTKIIERPISVLYTPETLKKGQSFSSGMNMLSRILSPFS